MRRSALFALTLAAVGWLFVMGAAPVSAKNACACTCIDDPESAFTSLSATRTECGGDCAALCGGTGEVQAAQLVDVRCVPGPRGDADCRVPPFNVYEGVSCVMQTAQNPQPWSVEKFEGREPTCVVPLTPKNANIECASFGGVAAGGTCGPIEGGEDPNTYHKSRPQFGKVGKDYLGTFTIQAWRTVMNTEHPGPPYPKAVGTDGICYQYGLRYGGLPTYEGFDPGPNGENAFGAVPSNGYVCLKKKRDLCGTKTPPIGQDPMLPARSYTCQDEDDVRSAGKNPANVCFDGDGLCVDAGERCCQGGTVFAGCLVDSDCSLDRTRTCVQGQCVQNPICDPSATERRCRYASPAERAVPARCTPESILPSATSRCINPSYGCCVAPDPGVGGGGCASDVLLDQGSNSVFSDFGCIDQTDLPRSQFFNAGALVGETSQQLRSIESQYGDPTQYQGASGARCLTSPLIQMVQDANGDLVASAPIKRCTSPAQVCCDKPAIAVELAAEGRTGTFQEDVAQRKAEGIPCAPQLVCRSTGEVFVSLEAASPGQPRDDLLTAAMRAGACKITPTESGGILDVNNECFPGYICCSAALDDTCKADADCATGKKCDRSLKVCVDAGLVDAQLGSAACGIRARGLGAGAAIDNILWGNQGVEESALTCQVVESSNPAIGTACVPQGCEGTIPSLQDAPGTVTQCCVPGTGLALGAAAAAGAAAPVEAAPFGLVLPACIQTGNCGLNEVVFTGAQFANFLIQISGAVFLGIFVWGGFKYLTAGTSKRSAEAKEMIIKATLAMALMMSAFVFIRFVQSALIEASVQQGTTQKDTCGDDTQTASFSCISLPVVETDAAAISKEMSARGCAADKCVGPANRQCCPLAP
ncbi:MAG: hypothetical protein RL141_621 [Candidatus Parcubacteria bacterium]|jgi:hypothetical protein